MKTGVLTSVLLLLLLAPFAPASAREAEPRIVAFGDSITYGTGADAPRREAWPELIGARRVAKAGAGLVGGKRPAIEQYREKVLTKKPDVVIVAYGMNDLKWSATRDIMEGLRQIKWWNRARGIETWVATLTPLRTDPWGLDPYRLELNERIRSSFYRVIDFDAALAEHDRLPRRFDSGDGLHPNARAYAVMAKTAGAAVRKSS